MIRRRRSRWTSARALMTGLEPRVLLSGGVPEVTWDPGVGTPTVDVAASEAVGALYPLTAVPVLHSNPSATQRLYLDFDGMTLTGTWWNDAAYPTIHAVPFDLDGDITTFSDAEITRMQGIWERVAEDYAPFNIDVTTVEPPLADFGTTKAQRVLISTDKDDTRLGGNGGNWVGGTYGGIAYYNTWSSNSGDQPCWVFYNNLGSGNEKYTAEAASHEAGHTVGLRHDGTTAGVEYYQGQGSGDTGWAPIMGVGYYQNLVQFSKGEYANANNKEDDLAIIASTTNKIAYRADDHGNTIGVADPLTVTGSSVSGSGIITTRTDVDMFRFTSDAGSIHLRVDPAARGPNLDVQADLYNAAGTLLASSNPADYLYADITFTLAAGGTYYLKIDGVGKGDPLTTGYTDYASLGQYTISGTIVPSVNSIAAPSNLTATPVSTTQINLAWVDNSNNELGFRIERSVDGGNTWSQIADVGAGVGSFSDVTVVAGATYSYRVYAYNASATSDYSNTATATTVPLAPASASATAIAFDKIDVSWSDVSGETSFRIERSPNGSTNWAQVGTTAVNVTLFHDTGLTGNTTYYYRIFAVNAGGSSAPSPIASATTPALLAPTAPTNLRSTAATRNSITLAWNDNSNNETGFRIERSTNGGATWTTAGTVGANVTTYRATGLKRLTTYTFRVAAYNAVGSSYSNTLTVSTTRSLPVGQTTPTGVFSTTAIKPWLSKSVLDEVLVAS